MDTYFASFGTDNRILIIVLIVLFIILFFRTIAISMRINRLEKKYKAFMKGSDAASLEKQFIRKLALIDKLYESKEDHEKQLQSDKQKLEKIYSKYGIEKYDAFDDVGGKISFALAMLDHENSGIILNAVHSRDNCFLYLKEIVKGESYVMLSQEEVEALRKAVNFGLGNIDKDD